MKREFIPRQGPRVEWKTILVFMAGTAAGVTVALLTAPVSGRDARAHLKRRSGEAVHAVAEQGRHLWHQQTDRVASTVQSGRREAATAIRRGVRSALGQAKAAYRAARPSRFGNGANKAVGFGSSVGSPS
jgi:gas vesicle protein